MKPLTLNKRYIGMSKIEQQVMASVAVIHTTRRIFSATALKVYALVASVYALGILVWVSEIQANFFHAMNNGVLAVGNYVLVALTQTELAVQAVLLVATVALFSLALDVMRSLTPRPRLS